jgi:hypothetical protein
MGESIVRSEGMVQAYRCCLAEAKGAILGFNGGFPVVVGPVKSHEKQEIRLA